MSYPKERVIPGHLWNVSSPLWREFRAFLRLQQLQTIRNLSAGKARKITQEIIANGPTNGQARVRIMTEFPSLGAFIRNDGALQNSLAFLRELGVPTCHLGIDSGHLPNAERRSELKQIFTKYGMKPTVVYCLFEGESYIDIATVRRTVGLVPKAWRDERLARAKEIAALAAELGSPAVGLHIGFIPTDSETPSYREVVAVTRQLAKHCAELSLRLHLETGQETADLLLTFLQDLGCDNVAVNFDPANMILYGSGDPIEAATKLAPHIRSVHCKDATWAGNPGVEWGKEVPLGEGHVDFRALLEILKKAGYTGPLTIEREISGEQQHKDIARAVDFLRNLLQEVW